MEAPRHSSAQTAGHASSHGSLAAGGSGPAVRVDLAPAGILYIDRNAAMPRLRASATLPPQPPPAPGAQAPALQYEWKVTLSMPSAKVPHARGRAVVHTPIQQTTNTPTLDIPFQQVRGGDLTVKVTVRGGGRTLTGEAKTEIRGTNPTAVDLSRQGADANFIKLLTQETQLRQFLNGSRAPGMPLFSEDNLGGVGLGQVTRPRPTDDQIWSWKSNLQAAQALFEEKKTEAKNYLDSVGRSARFKTLAAQYNAGRAAAKLKPLTITLPYTTDQLERETIRRYNGEADGVREFVIATDAKGGLVVTVDEKALTGTAQWHEVTGAERRQQYKDDNIPEKKWGDPDYVDHVLG